MHLNMNYCGSSRGEQLTAVGRIDAKLQLH